MKTSIDFTPFYRSSVGFDRVFNLLDNASRVSAIDNWPPYDIARLSDDQYRITMAVAGFAEKDLDISHQPNLLEVSGRSPSEESGGEYLHRSIAGRSFSRRFDLADHVKVTGASLQNGLLTIELEREIPEEMRPRKILINKSLPEKNTNKQIEGQKDAA